jgi:glucokinase
VEQYASATGIVNMAKRFCAEVTGPTPFVDAVNAAPDEVTAKMVYDYVKEDDPIARKVHATAMKRLARVCGIICNAFAPDRIVLGGGVLMAGDIIIQEVSKNVPKYCWTDIWKRCEIVRAVCGEDAGVLGAGAMVFEEMGG